MSLVSLAKGGHLGEGAVGLARIILQLQSYVTPSSSCKPDLTEKGEIGVGTSESPFRMAVTIGSCVVSDHIEKVCVLCVRLCMCGYLCPHAGMWKPEENMGYPVYHFLFYDFEMGSLTKPSTRLASRKPWQSSCLFLP